MKAKFGSIVTEGRGKVNGHVLSKNRGGAYMRTKVTPVNPRTPSQIAARARFGGFSVGWRTLTDTQRIAWNSAVSAYATTDIFGDLRSPSGLQLYQRLNNNLVASGGTAISSPVAPKGVSTVTIGALTYTSGTPALSLAYSANVPAGTRVKVFATAPLSPGVYFVKSQLRLITTLAAAAVSPANILVPYQTKFGATGAVGTKIFVAIQFVDQVSGLSSPRQIVSAISAS
jgi:hypothetical protein